MDKATIILPFYYDSDDRMANLLRTLIYLSSNLEYNIILVNQNIHNSKEYIEKFLSIYDINNDNYKICKIRIHIIFSI